MTEGKWPVGLEPEMPLRDAAHLVLKARLEAVPAHLPGALHEADRDPEHVHQLRVATRRADAALRIFRDCLRDKPYRAARARLRGLRRAAGAARDWDVFLLALRDRLTSARANEVAGVDFLIAYSLGQRSAAQHELQTVAAPEPEAFPRFVTETVTGVRSPPHAPEARLIDLARPMLATQLHRFHQAAARAPEGPAQLHQARIRGKRLRYAIEVLACCFAPTLRERYYPLVEEMQETLGRANDSQVAIDRLRGLRDALAVWPAAWQRARAGIEGLLRSHQRRLPQERRRFLAWWGQWQASGAEAALAEQGAGSARES